MDRFTWVKLGWAIPWYDDKTVINDVPVHVYGYCDINLLLFKNNNYKPVNKGDVKMYVFWKTRHSYTYSCEFSTIRFPKNT